MTLFDTYENQLWESLGKAPLTEGLRFNALKAARENGLPTARDEDWRYSKLANLSGKAYGTAPTAATPSTITPFITDRPVIRLVFLNGQYSEALSDQTALPKGVSITHIGNQAQPLRDREDSLVVGTDGIANLNAAMMSCGLVITVDAGVTVSAPIEIIHQTTQADDSGVHIRNIIELGEGAALNVIEQVVGDDADYWLNTLTQVQLSARSSLTTIKLQEDGSKATHTSKTLIDVDAGAKLTSLTLQLGASYGRVENHVRVLGEGAEVFVDGATLAGTGQTLDTFTHVSHLVENSVSDQIFRAVASGKGKTAFQGKVTVAKGAQKTLADQSCRNLLLDRTAEANAKPELEIYADDVKCSHGATVGELDQKAWFYLVSRGISPDDATAILVEAFASDSLVHIEDDDLCAQLNQRLIDWMKKLRTAA